MPKVYEHNMVKGKSFDSWLKDFKSFTEQTCKDYFESMNSGCGKVGPGGDAGIKTKASSDGAT